MKQLLVFFACLLSAPSLHAQEISDYVFKQKTQNDLYYYVQAGWQWSGHSGIDASIKLIIRDKWTLGTRMWMSDYSSKQYPKLKSNDAFNDYPYSHEEYALQSGWFHTFNKHWFATLETGPSYVHYYHPVGIDTITDTKGKINFAYRRVAESAMGCTFSGSINWHHDWLAAGISPQYFVNKLHSYSAVTVSIFFYMNDDH